MHFRHAHQRRGAHHQAGTHIHVHIFVAEKGDYYEIGDGAPQFPRTPMG